MREVSVFDIFAFFLTVGECIEDKRFIFLSAVGKYNSCTLLLHMCHSWSEHVLKTRYMGEGVVPWCEILGHHFSSRQLPKSRASTLNGVDVLICDHHRFSALSS